MAVRTREQTETHEQAWSWDLVDTRKGPGRGRCVSAWDAGSWGTNCVVIDEKGRGESPLALHRSE